MEFQTIVDLSTYNPAMNSNFTNMPGSSSFLWTSSEYSGDTSLARAFKPYDGSAYYGQSKGTTYKVLCVSGNELLPAASSDFVTSSDGKTVTDKKTGLIWQKSIPSGIKLTWQAALSYCQSLNGNIFGGYSTGWRLPNKNELASLLDADKSDKPYSNFPGDLTVATGEPFWSSSTYNQYSFTAFNVDFNGGATERGGKDVTLLVKCVRNAE